MNNHRAHRLNVFSLVLAPALLAAALLVDVSSRADDTRELLTLIGEKSGAWSAGQVLFLLSAVAWLPAGLVLMRLFGREARVGRIAAAAVAAAGLAMLPIDAAGIYLGQLATSGIPLDRQVSLVEGVEGSPILLALESVHVVGLMLGLLLVGVAMLRHRDLPRWAGILVVVGLVGIVVAPGRPVLAGASALLVLGLGVAGRRLSRVTGSDGGQAGREPRSTRVGRRSVDPAT